MNFNFSSDVWIDWILKLNAYRFKWSLKLNEFIREISIAISSLIWILTKCHSIWVNFNLCYIIFYNEFWSILLYKIEWLSTWVTFTIHIWIFKLSDFWFDYILKMSDDIQLKWSWKLREFQHELHLTIGKESFETI